MKVIVCGSRYWSNTKRVYQILDKLDKDDLTIIEGGANGADACAAAWARLHNIPLIEVPAEWDKYAKVAGPRRNRQMLDNYGQVDEVIAFHNALENSKGTKDMVNYAISKKVPVALVSDTELKWLP
jgi:hypothetical protein